MKFLEVYHRLRTSTFTSNHLFAGLNSNRKNLHPMPLKTPVRVTTSAPPILVDIKKQKIKIKNKDIIPMKKMTT